MSTSTTTAVCHLLIVLLFILRGTCYGQRLLCEVGDDPPLNRVDTSDRVAQLRAIMADKNIQAYIVLTNDDHQSEYVSASDERRRFISGFSGSAGWAVITATKQALWTDSRYYLQADQQLDCNWILMRDGLPGVVKMEQWLADELNPNDKISCDFRTVPHSQWLTWTQFFEPTGEIVQETDGNFVDDVWGNNRPPYSKSIVFSLNTTYTGLTWKQKAQEVATKVHEEGASAHVITALDEIAWLLNVRADDVDFLPVVRSYVILEVRGDPSEEVPKITWYVDQEKVTQELRIFLGEGTNDAVTIKDYETVWIDLPALETFVLLSKAFSYNVGSSQAVYAAISDDKVKLGSPPVAIIKALKNPTEVEGMKRAHIRDAAALIIFLAKLEAGVLAGEDWDELKALDEVAKLRKEQARSMGPSFTSVSASGANAALPHYEPTVEFNSPINDTAIFKLDSGGQYLDGTTDVTRTMHYGTPSDEQVATYTRLLAGCATLNSAIFPQGTTLSNLEILVRGLLYSQGKDFGHGTTHGIGVFLGVHEAYNSTINENFFGSQEPGYYLEGGWGMRLENIVRVVEANFEETTADKKFLKFDTVTLVPYEPKLIDRSLLNLQQVSWLNNYNARIRNEVRPLLVEQKQQQALDWLDARTKPYDLVCTFSDSATLLSTISTLAFALIINFSLA